MTIRILLSVFIEKDNNESSFEISKNNIVNFFSPEFTQPVLRISHLNVWEVVSYTPMYLGKNLDARISSRVLDTKIERCLQSTVYNVCMQCSWDKKKKSKEYSDMVKKFSRK